jgi:hypothetical protein
MQNWVTVRTSYQTAIWYWTYLLLLYSNSICKQSSIPTSICKEMINFKDHRRRSGTWNSSILRNRKYTTSQQGCWEVTTIATINIAFDQSRSTKYSSKELDYITPWRYENKSKLLADFFFIKVRNMNIRIRCGPRTKSWWEHRHGGLPCGPYKPSPAPFIMPVHPKQTYAISCSWDMSRMKNWQTTMFHICTVSEM